jgi:hypothetical protein
MHALAGLALVTSRCWRLAGARKPSLQGSTLSRRWTRIGSVPCRPILAEMSELSWILLQCAGDPRVPFAAFICPESGGRLGLNGPGQDKAGRRSLSF